MDKDIKMNLIKGLLSGRLTKKQRRGYAELESVDKELKIQWNESGNKTIDLKIKEQIWEKENIFQRTVFFILVLSELGI